MNPEREPEPDPELAGVRRQLAEVAEKAATHANDQIGASSEGLSVVHAYLDVARAALRTRAISDPEPFFDEDPEISVGLGEPEG